MKKFLISLAVLVVILVAMDWIVGIGCRYFQYHSKGGDTGRMMYIADKMDAEVLIFGSSRAIHHYDPRIIEDSLHLSCYNCGRDGNGIIFNYGMYRLFRDRYTPKVIIYDIMPGFDLQENHDNEKYLEWLRYFYDREGIDSIFWRVDKTERWKMIPNMRRYNTKFVQLVSDWHSPQQNDIQGYRPLTEVMKYEPKDKEKTVKKAFQYDHLKMYYMKRLIDDCKAHGTKLIFMVSPTYHGKENTDLNEMKALAEEMSVPFLYYNNYETISEHRDYFTDSVHMNEQGAIEYTRMIVGILKRIFQ